MSAQRTITVGELLENVLNVNDISRILPAEQRAKLIAMPPEIVADEVNRVFRITLADGSKLNIHVKGK